MENMTKSKNDALDSSEASTFTDKSEELRSKDLAHRKNKNFKFLFNCSTIKNKVSENEDCDLVKINNQ